MAVTNCDIPVPPPEVWRALATADRYSDWVVGTRDIRGAEGGWPAVGSKFHHTVGVWPLTLKDDTVVLEREEQRRLVLEVRIRPLGRARVELTLDPTDTGTRVTMIEAPSSPLLVRILSPVLDPLIHLRNTEALRRLASVCTA
jgi:uncharacterized protein YndB with AHSA1/START domain